MESSVFLEQIRTAAQERLGALPDSPALDDEAIQARCASLAERLTGADEAAWERERESQVRLALEDVLTPGQWRTAMGAGAFDEVEAEPSLPLLDPLLSPGDAPAAAEEGAEDPVAMRTSRGLDGLDLLDAAWRAPQGTASAEAGPLADIGTYGRAIWSPQAQHGSAPAAPLDELSGVICRPAVADSPSDTRRLNRVRRAPGGVESHRPLGPMGAVFPDAQAASSLCVRKGTHPTSDPPPQDLAALPDAILDDLTG